MFISYDWSLVWLMEEPGGYILCYILIPRAFNWINPLLLLCEARFSDHRSILFAKSEMGNVSCHAISGNLHKSIFRVNSSACDVYKQHNVILICCGVF